MGDNMDIKHYFEMMMDRDASDMFYRVGGPVRMRINGRVVTIADEVITKEAMDKSIKDLTTEEQRKKLQTRLDIDLAATLFLKDVNHRFRLSIFHQRNTLAMVARSIRDRTNDFHTLNLPSEVLKTLSGESRGLVLLTGSAGSGKSTTIASMIDYINSNFKKHILTVEEPIEFIFKDKTSIINQRELGIDVASYNIALKAFTLQSPDVIFIGNIRDSQTMFAALNAAETGVLVLSTLHTINAAQTIERIINLFPPHQHNEIRMQLSLLLKGVISLRLIPMKDNVQRAPACEVMIGTATISRLIREGKTWEIPQFIEQGALYGMQTFNQALIRLINEDKITEETAKEFSDNSEELSLMLRGIVKK